MMIFIIAILITILGVLLFGIPGLVIGGGLGLVILAVWGIGKGGKALWESTTPPPPEDTHKPCPYCGEEVLIAAIKCKHCQSDLEA